MLTILRSIRINENTPAFIHLVEKLVPTNRDIYMCILLISQRVYFFMNFPEVIILKHIPIIKLRTPLRFIKYSNIAHHDSRKKNFQIH